MTFNNSLKRQHIDMKTPVLDIEITCFINRYLEVPALSTATTPLRICDAITEL